MSRPKLKKVKKVEKLAKGTFRLSNGSIGEDLGPCPYCGKAVAVVQEEGKEAVLHGLPICEKFEAEDPMMFIHNMRMKVAGPQPDDDEWPMPIKQEKPS